MASQLPFNEASFLGEKIRTTFRKPSTNIGITTSENNYAGIVSTYKPCDGNLFTIPFIIRFKIPL